MIKAEFSASLLQSSVSHDPSEIILIWWFAAHETLFNDKFLSYNFDFFEFWDKINKKKVIATFYLTILTFFSQILAARNSHNSEKKS